MNGKLTKRYVESIAVKENEEQLIWDSNLKGFGIRISPKGLRSYFVQYRNQFGHTRRMKLGVHGVTNADKARVEAKTILEKAAQGEDPSKEHQMLKEKPTMTQLAHDYLELYAKNNKRPKSYKQDKNKLDNIILKKWGQKKVEEITTHDIQILHYELKETPYMANRVRALVSKMFNLAIQWKMAKENPVNGVKKYQEFEKTRWLDDEEVCKLWEALDNYHNQDLSNVIRLLLLTGSRKNEVLQATWDQFDLKNGVWTKPAHFTKQKKEEHLPLSEPAIELLREMNKKTESNFLFPGKVPSKKKIQDDKTPKEEEKPLQEIKKGWASILKLAGLQNIRIHDLRHTHASHLVSDGEDLYTVGKLLGHTQVSTTKKYAHLANKSLKKATTVFGDKIKRLTSMDSLNLAKRGE